MKKTIAILLTTLLSTQAYALSVENDFTQGCFDKDMLPELKELSLDPEQCMNEAYSNNYKVQHLLAQLHLKNDHYYASETINYILKSNNSYTPKALRIYPSRNYARILGTMYEFGTHGAPMDADAAEYLYKFAIKLGDVKSMKNLSELYSDSRSDLQSEWIEKYNQTLALP